MAPTPQDRAALEYAWAFWARPKQLPPLGDWRVWLVCAGRGFGKTRTGAEWVRDQVSRGGARRVALVAATAADARDVMVEGDSGILAVSPPWFRPKYEPSKRRLTWPNGAIATTYSADEPNRLRGPQHDAAWADELAAWRFADAWDQLLFGLRLGDDPRVVVTTTPRPTPIVRSLLADRGTTVTRGSTYENRGNLAAAFLGQILKKYEGTRLGQQELHAQLLGDTPGALWTRAMLEGCRVSPAKLPDFRRIVVAVDPSVSEDGDACEAGIVVGALGVDGHAYILEDATLAGSPDEWARRAVKAYRDHSADRLVAEVNNGGALVGTLVRTVDPNVAYGALRASDGKRARAEPASALYEQGRVHHVGFLGALEDQLTTWSSTSGEKSPDRLDALVWLLTELVLSNGPAPRLPTLSVPRRL